MIIPTDMKITLSISNHIPIDMKGREAQVEEKEMTTDGIMTIEDNINNNRINTPDHIIEMISEAILKSISEVTVRARILKRSVIAIVVAIQVVAV